MGSVAKSESILQNLSVLLKKGKGNNKSECSDLLEKLKCVLFAIESRKDQHELTADFVQIICSNESTVLVALCLTWLGQILNQRKLLSLPLEQANSIVNWIWHNIRSTNDISILNSLTLIMQFSAEMVQCCVERMLDRRDGNMLWECYVEDHNLSDEEMYALANFFDALLNGFMDSGELSEDELNLINRIGNTIIGFHYNLTHIDIKSLQRVLYLIISINLLNKVVALSPKFGNNHISELLGISKMYLQFGIIPRTGPVQKVCASQQAVFDSAEESLSGDIDSHNRNNGGKVLKTRKPRAIAKAKPQRQVTQNPHTISLENNLFILDLKTSDSEMSETEQLTCNGQSMASRYQCARVRLASITLIGVLAKTVERKFLFGYWHALFPNFNDTLSMGQGTARDDLLMVAEHDPNTRCRCIALQIAAQLLLGSKEFLNQAEYNFGDCPSTFVPFTVSLGLMVVSIYKSFIWILTNECSLSVLTQVLRSLAALIQATSFQRMEVGIVRSFVEPVRRLIRHKDTSVQVSSLMVMEFLIARPELTPEMYEALNSKRPGISGMSKSNPEPLDFMDENLEIDEVEEFAVDFHSKVEVRQGKENRISKMPNRCSWLLVHVVHSLGISETTAHKVPPVRMECLQILSAMATHFTLIQECLDDLSIVLEKSLEDPLADVRLCAARCLDSCAYNIGRHLLENHVEDVDELSRCDRFWGRLLPTMMRHIDSNKNEIAALKVSLCDAFSNMGGAIFERLSNPTRMNLFSFLSGVSSDTAEEMIVRTAAVRALAVFILFPSLRGNLVFAENAAELMLRLVTNSNVLVRIKVFWSIGNVSDALLGDSERVSEDLLRRLIEAACNACSDTDKVRCNAVRTLGNLLRLYTDEHFASNKNRQLFMRAMQMLINCISTVGNAKVKWNACYAIGNLMCNSVIFHAAKKYSDLMWQSPMYSALCVCIVEHSNFKVRINAAAALTHIKDRSFFANHFERCWAALLKALELSHNLQNFYEYNHRDNLQEQLCLTICHLLLIASKDDFIMLKQHLTVSMEIVRNTWLRVVNRILPEKCAPLMSTSILLQERTKSEVGLSSEQKSAMCFIAQIFTV